MPATYSRAFANAQRNGQQSVACRAAGRLAWTAPFGFEGGPPPGPHALLLEKDVLVADALRHFTGVSTRGNVLWTLPKWPATPIVLEAGLVHHVSPQRRDTRCASDAHGRRVLDNVLVPGVAEEAWLALFEPVPEGLIAQVQYTDFPDLPAKRVQVMRVHRDTLGPTWSWERDGAQSELPPLSLAGVERIVTFVDGTTVVLERSGAQREAVPVAEFAYPLGARTIGVSAGDDGMLYWIGADGGLPLMACTDLAGRTTWSWQADPAVPEATGRPSAPPVLAPAHAVVVTASAVTAVANGRALWRATSREIAFAHATALGDGSVLVAGGRTLARLLADGRWDWRLTLPEPIVAPAVADALGAVYVLGRSAVYGVQ